MTTNPYSNYGNYYNLNPETPKQGFSSMDTGFSSAGVGSPTQAESTTNKEETTTIQPIRRHRHNSGIIVPEPVPEKITSETIVEGNTQVTFTGNREEISRQKELYELQKKGYSTSNIYYNSQGQGMSFNPAIVKREEYLSNQQGVFYDVEGKGYSQNPYTTVTNVKEKYLGLKEVTYASGSKELVNTTTANVYGLEKPISYRVTRGDKIVGFIDKTVDLPVSFVQKQFFSQPIKPLYVGKTVINPKTGASYNVEKGIVDFGSYLIPYYGITRFSKDVGVFGYKTAKNPSYPLSREGLPETLSFVGVGVLYGGIRGYKKYISEPLSKEFGKIKQTDFYKLYERRVERDSKVRYTESNKGIIVGLDPKASGQLLKDIKTTIVRERVKSAVVSFKVSDKGFGISRSGERNLLLNFEEGSSKVVDKFTVNRFGSKKSFVRISDITSTGETSTRVFSVDTGKIVYKSNDVARGFQFNLGQLQNKDLAYSLESSRKLYAQSSGSSRLVQYIGSSDQGFRVTIDRSRIITQNVKLDKYYTVQTMETLGYSMNSKGLFLAPVTRSKTFKTVLEFGQPELKLNLYKSDSRGILGIKNPQAIETISIKEDLNLGFKQLSRAKSKAIVKNYKFIIPKERKTIIGTFYTYGANNPFEPIKASKKGQIRLGLETEIISKQVQVIRVPKATFSNSFNPIKIQTATINLKTATTPKIMVKNTPEITNTTSIRESYLNRNKPIDLTKVRTTPTIRGTIAERNKNTPSLDLSRDLDRRVKPQTKNKQIIDISEKVSTKITQKQLPKTATPTGTKTITRFRQYTKTPIARIPLIPLYRISNKKIVVKTPTNKNSFNIKIPKLFGEEKYKPLASLGEVFKYESSTGTEAGYTKSKKASKSFYNQLYGKGNFNQIIKVER